MILKKLEAQKRIHPPSWLTSNLVYLTYTGSVAYGCNDEFSDKDLVGYCIPTKQILFPHLAGVINGFDRQVESFDQWQEAHVIDEDKQEWDFTVYNIVKIFRLTLDGNPNCIDLLYTDRTCVVHSTPVSELIRQNRDLFLSKKCYHTFVGYSYAQLKKIKTKNPDIKSKRKELIDKFGFDTKYASHLVRLALECEQILTEGTLDLRRDRELYKAIRRGEWTLQRIEDWFMEKEKHLHKLYTDSKAVPEFTREKEIKQLLLSCLEHHYGSLEKCVANLDKNEIAIQQIKEIIGKL